MRVDAFTGFAFANPPAAQQQAAAPVPRDRVELLEKLHGNGAEFQRKRLVGDLGWREATPRQAAQALANKDPNDLQVRLPNESWQPLRTPEDLTVLNAFQQNDLTQLGPLAQQLDQLLKAGTVFTQDDQPIGAWGAYARIQAGEPVQVKDTRLVTPQDVAMLSYLQNLAGPEALDRPELGAAVKTFHEQGYLTRNPVHLYREQPAQLGLEWHGVPVGNWQGGHPEALLPQLEKQRLDYAREQLGQAPEPIREEAAREFDRLPAANRADFKQWLARLEHPQAAANLAKLPEDRQKALSEWLEKAVPQPVGQFTWAERDGIWSDSPDGPYLNHQTSCLSLPPINLRHTEGGTFKFKAQYALENNSDWVILEASPDGQNWDQLKSFTGKGDWAEHEVSLAAYRNGNVQLRFRLKSDGSNVYDGISLQAMSVTARPVFQSERSVLWPTPKQPLVEAFAGAAAQNQPLEALQTIVAALGPGEAVRLWQALPAELESRTAELAPRLGTHAAVAVARSGGEPATFEASRRLAAAPDDLEQVMRIHERLSKLPQASQEQVQRLVQRTCPDWTPQGGWHSTADGAWSDSPGPYKNNQNATLTTPPLDLRHFQQPVVTFRERHALENNSDWVLVEASRDGGQSWDTLKSFTGTGDWTEHKLDLASYGEGPLQLRFRLKTDGSNVAEGLDFADFRLDARPTLAPGAPSQLVFSDQARAWRETLDRVLEESAGPRLERLDKLSEKLHPSQALSMLALPGEPEALSEAALRIGTPAAQALADRLDQVGAFEVTREVARQLQQPLVLDELVAASSRATAQTVPNLLGWTTDTWVRGGAGVWSDNRSGRYRPNSNNSLAMPAVSLAGQTGAKLRFDCWWETENNSDWVRLEARRDGKEWMPLKAWTGASLGWKSEEVDLSDFGESRVELRWRLTSDGSNEGAGFRLRGARIEDSEQTFFSDRPEDLAPLHEELVSRLSSPLSSLNLQHGLCVGLAVSDPSLMRMVEVQGLKAALTAWEDMSGLQGDALTQEVDLRNQSALFRRYGADPVRVAEALRDSELDTAGVQALGKLRDGLAQGGWKPTGDWGRTARGWSDSPNGPYKPNQNAALESPTLRVPAGGTLTLEGNWQLEGNSDWVSLMVGDKQLARWTGSGTGLQTVDLGAYAGQDVKLRFVLRSDGSTQYAGMDFWNLKVSGSDGRVAFRDDGGRMAADALLELASDVDVPAARRSRGLQVLAGVPEDVAARVLGYLGEHGLPTERALALIDRLPTMVIGASLEDLLTDGPGLKEQDASVLVGGVRVRKR